MNPSRRAFIKLIATTYMGACLGTLVMVGCSGERASDTPRAPTGSYRLEDGHLHVALDQVKTMLGTGGATQCTLRDMGGSEQKVIIVRPGEMDYRAFTDACTHNGKELSYLHGDRLLVCSGRSSRFDLDGDLVHGPAKDALRRYRVRLDGSELVVEL